MARYELLERAVIGGELMEAGREIEFNGVPGLHMKPLDKAAEAAKAAVVSQASIEMNPDMTGFYGFGATGHPPINQNPPALSGAAQPNQTLTCTTGDWIGDPISYAYQWMSDEVEVAGADNSYTVAPSDVGNNVSCVVTAINAVGTGEAESNAVKVPSGGSSSARAGT